MSEEDDILAAEHVLGTLSQQDEADAQNRARKDSAFGRRVEFWTEVFDRIEPEADVAAPYQLWSKISDAIEDVEAAPGTRTLRQSDGVWESIAPGIQRRSLLVDRIKGTHSYYVRMRKGAVLPAHSHGMTEQCVVLDGELSIGGTRFGKGDFHIADATHEHSEILAVTDALFFIHGAL